MVKELIIRVKFNSEKIATLINSRGFDFDNENDSEDIILTIGILEIIKQQEFDKLKTISKKQYE